MNDAELNAFEQTVLAGKKARLESNVKVANEKFDEAERIFLSEERVTDLSSLSWLLYEKAFVLNVIGEYKQAARTFAVSDEIGSLAKDPIQSVIGYFREHLTLYLGGLITVEEIDTVFSEVDREYNNYLDSPEANPALLDNARFNLLKRRFELAFEKRSSDFIQFFDQYINHPHMVAHKKDTKTAHEIEIAKAKARRAIVLSNSEEAISIFNEMFELNLPNVSQEYKFNNIEEIRERIGKATEEIARDYRDIGIALIESQRPSKRTEAQQAWEMGLALTKGRGNLRFQNDIRTLMSEHKMTPQS